MPKQSPQDRLRRLADGCCPVHGVAFVQVGNTEVNGKQRYVGECPRMDCQIRATTHEPNGPAVLLPEFEHLISTGGQGA
jgi:hypothetical protein